MSEETTETAPSLGDQLERVATLIESEREHATTQTAERFSKVLDELESRRSRTAPVHKQDRENEDPKSPAAVELKREQAREAQALEFTRLSIVGDARAPLYRAHENRHPEWNQEQRDEYRAARNPRMDDLTKDWVRTIASRDVGTRMQIVEQMEDEYFRGLGFSRAPLLEGTPDADSGFADGTGAELLPLPLANQLMMERDTMAVMRGLVNVYPMTAQTERVPVLPIVTASSRAENAAYVDNTPDPSSALLSAKDIGVTFSAGRNFLEDSAFNIANQLTVRAGGAIGTEEDVQICTSTAAGGDITEGLDAATITDVAENTTGSIYWDDLVALFYSVPKEHRRTSVFLAAGTTLQDLLTTNMLDSNGRPILIDQFQAPRPLQDNNPNAIGFIMGRPIYEVPVADDVIYFGDPMWYALGQRSGIRVDTDRAVSTGLRTWVIDERIDGRVIPTAAVGTNNTWRKIVY